MFTYLIYAEWLSQPDDFWAGHHIWVLWLLAFALDLMLAFVLWVAALSAMALMPSRRAGAVAGLRRVTSMLRAIDRVVLILAGVALALMIAVTFFSVIGRTVWKPIPDDYTWSEWALVLVTALMLGTIQGRGEHIEVTALAEHFSERVNRWLRLLGVLVGAWIVCRLAWISLEEVPDSFLEITYGSIYDLPMWPARLIFMLGVGWWCARIVAQALLLPITQFVDPVAAGAPPDWELTPLLPSHAGAEVESSGGFIDTTAADERQEETRG